MTLLITLLLILIVVLIVAFIVLFRNLLVWAEHFNILMGRSMTQIDMAFYPVISFREIRRYLREINYWNKKYDEYSKKADKEKKRSKKREKFWEVQGKCFDIQWLYRGMLWEARKLNMLVVNGKKPLKKTSKDWHKFWEKQFEKIRGKRGEACNLDKSLSEELNLKALRDFQKEELANLYEEEFAQESKTLLVSL